MGKEEDTKGFQVPGQGQGLARLDAAISASEVGTCSQSPARIVAGTVHYAALCQTCHPRHPISNPVSHENVRPRAEM